MKMAFEETVIRWLVALVIATAVTAGSAQCATPDRATSESSTTHVNVKSQKSFDEITAAIEKQLGKYDGPAVAKMFAAKQPPAEIEAKIHSMEGSSGFMLFTIRDHGQLLPLKGKQGFARQYELGNPLFAVQMTQEDIRAAEYAPLRVLIYVGEDKLTHIDYDLPSTVFGRLHNAAVDKVAHGLDEKLAALVANALSN
jgi:uncharacterized protein (DUF302 family)